MAKKSKTSKGASGARPRQRRERRFEPRASASATLVYVLGGVGAVAMGAGTWEEGGALLRDGGPEPFKYAAYVLAAGALLAGAAVWIGTSGDPALRVGDGGIAVERGGIRRLPWYAIERIEWAEGVVRVTGTDDAGSKVVVNASLVSQAQAAAWLVREARDRVPAVVEVPKDAPLPDPLASAGESLPLDPPQVVGKHCAASGKVIAYEPDARVCPRCERVYHKATVPETCECGGAMSQSEGVSSN